MAGNMMGEKWSLPGWRIEQKFAPNVLIGNWYEERREFAKKRLDHNSTHRIDFRHHPNHQPDVMVRRKGMLRSDGVKREQLLYHHGKKYNDNIYISMYDEQINRKVRTNPLPETREWDGRAIAWLPEKSDHPAEGQPTNWGLLESKQRTWAGEMAADRLPGLHTTYTTSYERPAGTARLTPTDRRAIARHKSTALHSVNATLKDLKLRGQPNLKMPELLDETTLCSLAKVNV